MVDEGKGYHRHSLEHSINRMKGYRTPKVRMIEIKPSGMYPQELVNKRLALLPLSEEEIAESLKRKRKEENQAQGVIRWYESPDYVASIVAVDYDPNYYMVRVGKSDFSKSLPDIPFSKSMFDFRTDNDRKKSIAMMIKRYEDRLR